MGISGIKANGIWGDNKKELTIIYTAIKGLKRYEISAKELCTSEGITKKGIAIIAAYYFFKNYESLKVHDPGTEKFVEKFVGYYDQEVRASKKEPKFFLRSLDLSTLPIDSHKYHKGLPPGKEGKAALLSSIEKISGVSWSTNHDCSDLEKLRINILHHQKLHKSKATVKKK